MGMTEQRYVSMWVCGYVSRRDLLTHILFLLALAACLLPYASLADTHYVDVASTNPVAPYTNWVTAATNIQDAIGEAGDGDTVLVTNGVYSAGGAAVNGIMTNRVAVTNSVVLGSVNGPDETFIEGQESPGGSSGDGAVRCVYLSSNAMIHGFTLRNGHTRSWDVTNLVEGCGGGVYCASTSSVVSNCVITLNHAANWGGGVVGGTVVSCTIFSNSATESAGVDSSIVWNSELSGNQSYWVGGAGSGSTFRNCLVRGNKAEIGGGTSWCSLENCTVVDNFAIRHSGGVYGGVVENSIVYYNRTDLTAENSQRASFSFSCTHPLAPGIGNITRPPGFYNLDTPRLVADSPCRNSGTNFPWTTNALDLAGQARILDGTVDMGCYEFSSASVTGAVSAELYTEHPGAVLGLELDFESRSTGMIESVVWNFGDGQGTSATYLANHTFTTAGVYEVVLTVSNATDVSSDTVSVTIVESYVTHVDVASTNPVYPYTNLTTAATNIQDAIDAHLYLGGTVLVNDGIYTNGGNWDGRVVIHKRLYVRSMNGPATTIIHGGTNAMWGTRCAYLQRHAVLAGFTLEKGEASVGAAVNARPGSIVSNCIMRANVASDNGGGIAGGTAVDCLITGNTASWCGGGAYGAVLRRCTVQSNRADVGGGAYNVNAENCLVAGNQANEGGGTYMGALRYCSIADNSATNAGGALESQLESCIVYHNTAVSNAPNISNFVFGACSYTCTPTDPEGDGNITNEPSFVSRAARDYRLRHDSPCIDNAAGDTGAADDRDLEDNPRVFNGAADMGAYEFTMLTDVTALLAGAYDTNNHEMTTVLRQAGHVPTNAIYVADRRSYSALPSNAIDWVLLQLLNTNDFSSAAAKSVFLRKDGKGINDDGSTGIRLECPPGYYYLAAKHRNHCAAVSAQPVAYTNALISYDFSAGPGKFRGGTNACVQLEPGVWGMVAGDADGDGEITHVDKGICERQQGLTGYKCADFNLDGIVDGND